MANDVSKECCQGSCNSDPETSDKITTFKKMIPADKALSPEWIKMLYQRGNPEIYSGDELTHIGMPVSGICTGQVYLSGDGRLWHWDVFKTHGGTDEPIDPRGFHYADPVSISSPLDQGFVLEVFDEKGDPRVFRLDASGFNSVSFEGQYPIGRVNYSDDECPLEISLEAFSPFIPLDQNNSGLPVTVMEYTFKNCSERTVPLNVAGWLENKICRYDDQEGKGERLNKVSRKNDAVVLSCYANAVEGSAPELLSGYGDMSLALLDSVADDLACSVIDGLSNSKEPLENLVFKQIGVGNTEPASKPFGSKTVGAVGRKLVLQPGEEQKVRFAVSWYFPKYTGGYVFHSSMEDIPNLEQLKRHYAKQFDSSQAVIAYLANNYSMLSESTRLWRDTWYDSSLPHWLLTRTFASASTLATQTCHWFDNERFYAWEGVDCCPGTCQHVWQYAQTVARLFPDFERFLREEIDYGIAYKSDGSLEYRAEASNHTGEINMKSENDAEAFFAADGQLGTIIRVYREHTMSADSGFLSRIWPRVKKSLEFMMTLDTNGDGLLDSTQFHTLDTSWHGEIPWISSLYLAALAAGKKMGLEMNDKDFAEQCDGLLNTGRKNFTEKLFNGEYFVHHPDPDHPDSMNLTEGSYIDQVFGQSYVMQLGLERVIPEVEAISALKSLWKYNYTPDVGPYRENFKDVEGGRWYAMPGEGGVLVCTWPKGDCNRAEFEDTLLGLDVTSEGYLNEVFTGFEYQIASHMIAEGLLEEGLAVTRTVHDRYHPSKRNPWNEVECSDHYSRAMSSYGVFLNICGFDYHGPEGYLAFSPKLNAEKFRAAFTTAKGWGSFSQIIDAVSHTAHIELHYGELSLNKLGIDRASQASITNVSVNLDGITCECSHDAHDKRIEIVLKDSQLIRQGQKLTLQVSYAE